MPNRPLSSNRSARRLGGLRLSVLALSMLCATPLMAQSIYGGIYGKTKTQGVSVVISNPSTGYTQTVKPNSQGTYSVSHIAPGQYNVKVMLDGAPLHSKNVTVRAGASSAVVFASSSATASATASATPSTANAQNMSGVTAYAPPLSVTPIDVSSVDNTKIWNMSDVNKLPGARGLHGALQSVTLLQSTAQAPGEVDSAAGYAGGYVQVNGAAPNENRYYVNGFDMTDNRNMLTPPGLWAVPNEALSSVQLKNTGYGVEYGNATGGVTSGTVKQGDNVWRYGASLYYQPPTSKLNPNSQDIRNRNNPELYNSFNSASHQEGRMVENYWASGPIIKDKLFIYALDENHPPSRRYTYGGNNGTTKEQFDTKPSNIGLVNLTWNIDNNNTVDGMFMRMHDTTWYNRYHLNDPYNPGSADKNVYDYSGSTDDEYLGVLHYTGELTDNLRVNAMYGFSKFRTVETSKALNDNSGQPYAAYYNYDTQSTSILPGASAAGQFQPDPSIYENRGYSISLDFTPNDQHDIQFGLQRYTDRATSTTSTNTNGYYTYYVNHCGTGLTECALPNGASLADGTPYVVSNYSYQHDNERDRTAGIYLSDNWQVSDNVVVYGGLRHDTYVGVLDTGDQFMHLPFNSPRLGVAWDVYGDSSLKLGATLGRYAEIMGLNYNDLAGAAYTDRTTYLTYSCGSEYCADNGYVPQNTTQIGRAPGTDGNLPLSPTQHVSGNVKPSYQDELSIYALKQFTPSWTGSATFYVAKLKNLMEYWNDSPLINQYLTGQGYDYQIPSGDLGYLYNPGKDLKILLPVGPNGALKRVTVPNSYLGMPHPHRTTYQLTLDMNHSPTQAQPWFLDVSYTWRHEFGNTTGGDDVAGGGTNNPWGTGYDTAWEAPAFQDGSNGNLPEPNGTLKINGYYHFANGLRVGGSYSATTGIPLSCYSYYPNPGDNRLPQGDNNTQGAFYCGGSLHPRGHAGTTGFTQLLALNVGYDWKWREYSFSLDLDMTNVFNTNKVLELNQVYNNSVTDTQPSDTYMTPSLRQAPRTTMLSFRWRYR
ncbi:carboxypeptidase regulatory-like domain-containing protein [Oleiagrimonas sp. C23AA]|uniref:TonB-dependent receptor n=1 Tax=Oleiagrimonas sp. C23AA TaxID=2719047 RepID=UPI001422C6B6|nr:carboxypeptidase regulatory-like domain-containing protein [Oleiagrimonas sp. C23AA]NII10770.1 TonB-dependent receptor [Oleiagrimonas sp. C23AA]